MKLFSGFLLVLAFLAVSACTDEETTEVVKILCSTTGELLEEGEKCPPPEDTSNNNTPGNQGGSTGGQTDTDTDTNKGEPTRQDCKNQVMVATSDEEGKRFEGTTGDDIICGNERNDVIDGRKGDDTIFGGPGNDTLIGGDDRDVLKGEAGNDTLSGGQDNDTLDGGGGTDTADYSKEYDANTGCEEGIDKVCDAVVVNLAERHATDTYGDEDTLIGIENVIGTPVDDTIIGDDGPNEIEGGGVDSGDEGTETLNGGGGSDTIVVTTTFSLAAPGNDFEITSIENIKAKAKASGAIDLTGDEKNNVLTGNEGNNVLTGGAGNDTLVGGAGDDKLIGGTGMDRLTGGAGEDCFQIDLDEITALIEKITNAPDAGKAKAISDARAAISATRDSVMDYSDVDTISGVEGTDVGQISSVSSGSLSVILVAAELDNNNEVVAPAKTAELMRVNGPARATIEFVANCL